MTLANRVLASSGLSGGAPAALLGDESVKSAGLGQIVASGDPGDTLVAYGLGSCVGVVGFDPGTKVGGLLHALLPQHRPGEENLAKFVDTGIPRLVLEMERLGARRRGIIWYLVGGAEMLRMPGMTAQFNIGSKNSAMAQSVMAREGLPVRALDLGGSSGRTVKLSIQDGKVMVRTLGQGERAL